MADSVIPQLVSRGRIKAAEVLAVVDRRAFVPRSAWGKIDVDQPTAITSVNSSLDSIMHYATLLEALDIKKGNSVLDIGCGCGHLTAIAGYLAGKTGYAVGIDLNPAVVKYAQESLSRLDVKLENIAYFPMNVYFMDKKVKFDRIVVGVACPSTHVRSIISQLNVSGILVTPMPDGKIYQIKRINDDEWTKEVVGAHKAAAMAMPQSTDNMVKGAELANSSLEAMKAWIASRRALASRSSSTSISPTGSTGSASPAVSSLVPLPESQAINAFSPSDTIQQSGSNAFGGSSGSSGAGATSTNSLGSLGSSGGTPIPLSMSGSGGVPNGSGKSGAVQYYCDRCRARIPPGGIRWRCDDCGDLDLCETCFDAGPPYPEPHDYFLHSNLVAFATGREPDPIDPSRLTQTQCTKCNRFILGLRWHCAVCPKYDLCAACHSMQPTSPAAVSSRGSSKRSAQTSPAAHTLDHPMIPFQEPGQRRVGSLSGTRPVLDSNASVLQQHQSSSPQQSQSRLSRSGVLSAAGPTTPPLDHSNLRSIVNQSANELLERLKLYDVHGLQPFAAPLATSPAPAGTPPRPMFNASLYTASPNSQIRADSGVSSGRMPSAVTPTSHPIQKGLLSGSSEDEKEDGSGVSGSVTAVGLVSADTGPFGAMSPARTSAATQPPKPSSGYPAESNQLQSLATFLSQVRPLATPPAGESKQTSRSGLAMSTMSAGPPIPVTSSGVAITYFGDEVGPPALDTAPSPSHTPLAVSTSLQISGSQSSILSPNLSSSTASIDVPIIKWSELEVGELLGSGAFGTVHAGRWRGAPVAIKRLHVAPDNPLEFMHEAAMMRKMSHHPNIIRLFGICDDPANFAIISQLCSNGSLHDILNKRVPGSVPWHKIVGIARDAAAGAYHLHCENLIHRDLACRNILVTENWTGVISDFGLSRVLENQNKSHRTATMSAVRWAAPESLKDEKYSSKSDVWSFGMCLVEILTRGPPFPNLTYAEILRAVYTDRPLTIDLPTECDPVVRGLVYDCCKQNPDDRIEFRDVYLTLDAHYKALVAAKPK